MRVASQPQHIQQLQVIDRDGRATRSTRQSSAGTQTSAAGLRACSKTTASSTASASGIVCVRTSTSAVLSSAASARKRRLERSPRRERRQRKCQQSPTCASRRSGTSLPLCEQRLMRAIRLLEVPLRVEAEPCQSTYQQQQLCSRQLQPQESRRQHQELHRARTQRTSRSRAQCRSRSKTSSTSRCAFPSPQSRPEASDLCLRLATKAQASQWSRVEL